MSEPTFSVEETVARFFPKSRGYDFRAAKQMMNWLAKCGYTIVRTDSLAPRSEAEPAKRASRSERSLENTREPAAR